MFQFMNDISQWRIISLYEIIMIFGKMIEKRRNLCENQYCIYNYVTTIPITIESLPNQQSKPFYLPCEIVVRFLRTNMCDRNHRDKLASTNMYSN